MATPKTARPFPLSASSRILPLPTSSKSKFFFIAFFAAIALAADQLSKWFAMRGGIAVTVNTGASFGTPFGLSAAFIPFMIIIVLAGLVAFLYRSISPLSLGLLVGAALSNVADRFWFGGVRDWLTVPLFGLRNNLADWILCLAIALAVVQSAQGIYGTKKREEKT